MTEFLHEVVKKREREQEHRNLTPRSYLDELSRQMQESYNRMTAQAVGAVYATSPSRTEGLTTIYGTMAVRTRSANQVDEYIRQNMIRHGNNLMQDTGFHGHGETEMQWVLEEISAHWSPGLGRRHFTYSCSLCGQQAICPELMQREVVGNAGLAV